MFHNQDTIRSFAKVIMSGVMYILTLITELGMAFFSISPFAFTCIIFFTFCKYDGMVARTKFCDNQSLTLFICCYRTLYWT